jgi:hypothetical protein
MDPWVNGKDESSTEGISEDSDTNQTIANDLPMVSRALSRIGSMMILRLYKSR